MSEPRTVPIIPSARALVQSLRGLGYSTETALADLIDNSISAQADLIEIDMQWNDGEPVIAILDDGLGMSEAELTEALRFGREEDPMKDGEADLGRYGFGLKTASLSQCQRMTVISHKAGSATALTFDLAVIAEQGWVALVRDDLHDHLMTQRLLKQDHGTLVVWENMDERSGLTGLKREDFYLRLQEVRNHLGMVFHRFLGGDARRLSITVNGRQIKPWDPFQRSHPATTSLRTERLRDGGATVTVTPWVLPHRDRFANEAEYAAAGGPGGWGARQGFYVYRGKRLLVAGSWLGLGGRRAWTRDEASRLARIQVDLPTCLDSDWRIDVRKSQARPPGKLRGRLTHIAASCRERAREVFAWRGRRASPRGTEKVPDAVWLSRTTDAGTFYTINRDHPAIASILAHAAPLRQQVQALLAVIERSVPVERIWLDISEAEGAPVPSASDPGLIGLVDQLASLAELLPQSMPAAERVEVLTNNLPNAQPELRSRLLTVLEARAA